MEGNDCLGAMRTAGPTGVPLDTLRSLSNCPSLSFTSCDVAIITTNGTHEFCPAHWVSRVVHEAGRCKPNVLGLSLYGRKRTSSKPTASPAAGVADQADRLQVAEPPGSADAAEQEGEICKPDPPEFEANAYGWS